MAIYQYPNGWFPTMGGWFIMENPTRKWWETPFFMLPFAATLTDSSPKHSPLQRFKHHERKLFICFLNHQRYVPSMICPKRSYQGTRRPQLFPSPQMGSPAERLDLRKAPYKWRVSRGLAMEDHGTHPKKWKFIVFIAF